MFIECTLKTDTHAVELDGKTYTFERDAKGALVCDVSNQKHVIDLLSIPEAFAAYRCNIPSTLLEPIRVKMMLRMANSGVRQIVDAPKKRASDLSSDDDIFGDIDEDENFSEDDDDDDDDVFEETNPGFLQSPPERPASRSIMEAIEENAANATAVMTDEDVIEFGKSLGLEDPSDKAAIKAFAKRESIKIDTRQSAANMLREIAGKS